MNKQLIELFKLMAVAQAESTRSRSMSFHINGHAGTLMIEHYPDGWSPGKKPVVAALFLDDKGVPDAIKFIKDNLKIN